MKKRGKEGPGRKSSKPSFASPTFAEQHFDKLRKVLVPSGTDPLAGKFSLRIDPCFDLARLFSAGVMGVISMELLSVIRRWALRDQLSIREISRRTGLSRNTIRKYLRADVAVFEREAHSNSRDRASSGQVRAGALANDKQFVGS